jgi:hypothetical protein
VQHLKERAGQQRSELPQLAAGTALHLEPGRPYTLVPRPWLAAWRGFVGAYGKRSGGTQPPAALPAAVANAFCDCHPGANGQPALLNYPPPAVVRRSGPAHHYSSMCHE